jgi:hypothetical protein
MAFTITNWNLNPNISWWVNISDNGSGIDVELYSTAADAVAGTNAIASSETIINPVAYGTDVEVVLVWSGSALTDEISYFNSDLDFHLTVSGSSGDPDITYSIAPFADIDPITDSIYRSDELIAAKSLSEINKHTHLSKIKIIDIAVHNPAMAVGDQVTIDSTLRGGVAPLAIIEEVNIVGDVNSIINQIQTIEYVDIIYG